MLSSLETLEPENFLRRLRSSSVYNVAVKTPLDRAPRLSRELGREVFLKREDLQVVHSFKLRGAFERISRLSPAELRRGVMAASAGNHAQGVALAALALGTRATIVVPVTTPSIKIEAILELGAELVLYGDNFDESYAHAVVLAEQSGRCFIHPYDDADVIVGQGTVGLEISEQYPESIDAVFVPVGGGGLISGIVLALKQLRPGVKVIGVEAEDAAAMSESLARGSRVTLGAMGLFVDGCAVRRVGELTYAITRDWVDEVVTVTNDEICAAIREIYEDRRVVVEPAGALGVAAMKRYVSEHADNGALITILSGANLNFDRLQFIAERTKIGNRSEAVLAIEIPEKPGTFRRLCGAFGRHNITEFNYRYGDKLQAVVFVGLSIRGEEDFANVRSSLLRDGFSFTDLSGDEVAKTHVRHMVGGRSDSATDERIFKAQFPEKPGALAAFLEALEDRWNISVFHYRNHGADIGNALVGFQVPAESHAEFEAFVAQTPICFEEQTGAPSVQLFLKNNPHVATI